MRFGLAAAAISVLAVGIAFVAVRQLRRARTTRRRTVRRPARCRGPRPPVLGGDRAMPDGSTVQNVQLEFTSDALAIWQEGGIGDPVLSSSAPRPSRLRAADAALDDLAGMRVHAPSAPTEARTSSATPSRSRSPCRSPMTGGSGGKQHPRGRPLPGLVRPAERARHHRHDRAQPRRGRMRGR